MKNIKLTMAAAAAFMAMGTMVGCSDENSSSAPVSPVSETQNATNVSERCMDYQFSNDAISFAKETATVDYATAEKTENGSHIVLPPFTTTCGYKMEFTYEKSNDTLYVTSKGVEGQPLADCICNTAYEFDVNVAPGDFHYLNYGEQVYDIQYTEKTIPAESSSSEEIVPPNSSSSSVAVMEGFEVATNADGQCMDHAYSNDAVSLAKETATVDYATAEATEKGSHIVLPTIVSSCELQFDNQYKMSNDTLYVVSTVIESMNYADCICNTSYEFDVNVFPGKINYLNNRRYGKETIYEVHNITMGYERETPISPLSLADSALFAAAANESGKCLDHGPLNSNNANSLAKEAATDDYATAEETEKGAHILLPPFTTSCGYEMEFKYGMSNDTLYVTSKGVEGQPVANCICNTSYEFDVQIPFEIIGYLYYEEKVYKVQKMVKAIHPVENPVLE